MKDRDRGFTNLWARHSAEWRDTAQIASHWREAAGTDPRLLETRADEGWWETLDRLGITLFVTREYEHLAMAATVFEGKPRLSFFPVPHPSGLTVDRARGRIVLASTRNPNQVYTFAPAASDLARGDSRLAVPVSTVFYPGGLYLHDLAFVGGTLCANAVGHNAVVRLGPEGRFERAWWPRSVEIGGRPAFDRNYIQLNSIAAGGTLRESFFSASSAAIGRLRPGHLNFPVDGRGVIFSGRTREPVCTGLTRPHSARLRGGSIWVANSGYGEVGIVRGGRFETVARLPGWTRGLCLARDVAFVGTSRVIPRYARYAPGLEISASRCGVHAVSCRTGEVLGKMEWPLGNQIFAIDWIGRGAASGFPFEARGRRQKQETAFFYSYRTGKGRPKP
jgi:uncharacterized protein (TIGR03032 family)